MRIFSLILAAVVTLVASGAFAQDVLLFEDFNDSTKTYVQNPNISTEQTNSTGSGSDFAYYGRAQAADIPLLDLNGWNGSHFYGAMDTDRSDPPDQMGGGGVSVPWNPILLNWTDVDIAGYENLEFSGLFGEADSFPAGVEAWTGDTSVTVEAQIDGGGFFQIFGIESGGGTAAPREDTNFDGVGDGTEIIPTMAEFTKSIAGTGSLLDLRITINNLNAFQKDIGFDDITVVGTVIPEPSSAAVLGLIAVGLFCGRRRRK